ncbi:12355_t:CDS:2, partial [Funneliformis caledonium]
TGSSQSASTNKTGYPTPEGITIEPCGKYVPRQYGEFRKLKDSSSSLAHPIFNEPTITTKSSSHSCALSRASLISKILANVINVVKAKYNP